MLKSAIIVAGGSGLRMNAGIPKQFLPIGGRPVLMHTIEKFYANNAEMQLIVVLPLEQMEYWKGLCEQFRFTLKHSLVAGGSERFFSVRNALEHLSPDGLVAVHDGVRPLVSQETIDRCFACAEADGCATPVVDSADSIRQIDGSDSHSVDRKLFRMVQTPQVFRSSILIKAYQQDFSPLFTDDASVVEQLGYKIHLVEGNRENIKLTTPMDLLLAEALMQQAQKEARGTKL